MRFSPRNQNGYVALEFVVAMGLLVLPTALILLQIPTFLERHNRVESVASIVAQRCADEANTSFDANNLALDTAQEEMSSSTIMNHVTLRNATCRFERIPIQPGDEVTSTIVISMPSALVPGADFGPTWTMTATHISIVPRYRSFEE